MHYNKIYQLIKQEKLIMQNNQAIQQCIGLLAALGFESSAKSSIPLKLNALKPSGGTSFRDSVIQGTVLMLKLYDFLNERRIAGAWNFVHIVLTDGEDSASKASHEQAKAIMYAVGQTVQVSTLKTIFLGVGINDHEARQMKELAYIGGQNSSYENVSTLQIGKIFEKISISLGLVQRQRLFQFQNSQIQGVGLLQENEVVLNVTQQNFAVLFNLDLSGSMSGSRWKSVCQNVTNFIQYLGPNDLVSGIVFNNEVKLLNQFQFVSQPIIRQQSPIRPAIRQQSPVRKPVRQQVNRNEEKSCACNLI